MAHCLNLGRDDPFRRGAQAAGLPDWAARPIPQVSECSLVRRPEVLRKGSSSGGGRWGRSSRCWQVRSRPKGAGHCSRGPRPRTTAPPGFPRPVRAYPSQPVVGAFSSLGCPFRARRLFGNAVLRAVPAAAMASGLRAVLPRPFRCPPGKALKPRQRDSIERDARTASRGRNEAWRMHGCSSVGGAPRSLHAVLQTEKWKGGRRRASDGGTRAACAPRRKPPLDALGWPPEPRRPPSASGGCL